MSTEQRRMSVDEARKRLDKDIASMRRIKIEAPDVYRYLESAHNAMIHLRRLLSMAKLVGRRQDTLYFPPFVEMVTKARDADEITPDLAGRIIEMFQWTVSEEE